MNQVTKAYWSEANTDWEQRVVDFLPLVHHVVGRLLSSLPSRLDRDDLYGAGVCGLVQAAKSYDASKGASFKTHAYTRVRGAILDEVRRADAIPREKRKLLKRVHKAHEKLANQLMRPPSLEELADELGEPMDRLDEVLELAQRASLLSLDANMGDDSDGGGALLGQLSSLDTPEPGELASLAENKTALRAALAELPKREREVLALYYYEGLLLREIGELLGVSESRVCQLHARAIYSLRGAMLRQTAPRTMRRAA